MRPEPSNRTLVLIGSLDEQNPWDLEIWVRDDETAIFRNEPPSGRWYQADVGCRQRALSWSVLFERAVRLNRPITVLATIA